MGPVCKREKGYHCNVKRCSGNYLQNSPLQPGYCSGPPRHCESLGRGAYVAAVPHATTTMEHNSSTPGKAWWLYAAAIPNAATTTTLYGNDNSTSADSGWTLVSSRRKKRTGTPASRGALAVITDQASAIEVTENLDANADSPVNTNNNGPSDSTTAAIEVTAHTQNAAAIEVPENWHARRGLS